MTIKEIRQLTGWTQSEFGKFLGIPMRTIQNWETGQRKCPDYVVDLIEFKIKYAMRLAESIAKALKLEKE